MNEPGLSRHGGVVVLSGPALRTAAGAVLDGIKWRRSKGQPFDAQEALACAFLEAMAATGHSDVRLPAVCDPVSVEEQPTVTVPEVAERLDVSQRQARRVAEKLGGCKFGGRWFVTETALREHLEGMQ